MELDLFHPLHSGQVAVISIKKKTQQEMDATTSKIACDLLFPTGRKLELTSLKPGVFLQIGCWKGTEVGE